MLWFWDCPLFIVELFHKWLFGLQSGGKANAFNNNNNIDDEEEEEEGHDDDANASDSPRSNSYTPLEQAAFINFPSDPILVTEIGSHKGRSVIGSTWLGWRVSSVCAFVCI